MSNYAKTWIFFILIIFEYIYACKINLNFQRLAVAPGVVKVCTDEQCINTYLYFQNAVIYRACLWDNNIVPKFRIYWASRELRWSNEDYMFCLNNKAINQFSSQCLLEEELSFIRNIPIRQTDAFILECGPWRAELPYENEPRIQVNPFYPRAVYLNYKLSVKLTDSFNIEEFCATSRRLYCVSDDDNCIICDINVCAVISDEWIHCYVKCYTWTLDFQLEKIDRNDIKLQLSIDDDIYGNLTNFPTSFISVDAMTRLTCFSSKFMVYIIRPDIPESKSVEIINTIEVKENENNVILINCYLGIENSKFKNSKITIIQAKLKVLTKTITRISATRLDHHNHEVKVESIFSDIFKAKFYSDTTIECLNRTSSLSVYTISKKVDLPMSLHLCDDPNTCVVVASYVVRWRVQTFKKPLFVRCYDGYNYAAPILLFTECAPIITFYNTYPSYPTLYALSGYIFGCKSNKGKLSIDCESCDFVKLRSYSFNDTNIAFSIPYELDHDMKLVIVCKILLLDGMTFNNSESYLVANSYFLSLNVNQIIPVVGQTISCKKYFTLHIENKSRSAANLEPIWITVNDKHYYSMKPNFTIPGLPEENISLSFSYCCPYLPSRLDAGITDPYSNLECKIYKPLIVAKTARIEYNLDVRRIFAGQTLRCYFCVNFSTQVFPVYECSRSQQVKSLISMNVTDPNGKFFIYEDREEVTVPIGEVNAKTRTFYKLSMYSVSIKCKIDYHSYSPIIKVPIYNCDDFPPPIFVTPSDITQLVVGDIVGCNVYLDHCKGKIDYTIIITTKTKYNHYAANLQSVTLELNTIGSHVGILFFNRRLLLLLLLLLLIIQTKVKCSAGKSEKVVAERNFRVVSRPQEITIKNSSIYHRHFMEFLTHGDYLSCNAIGYPPLIYKWEQLEGSSKLVILHNYVLITKFHNPGRYKMVCDTSNDYGTMVMSYEFIIYNDESINTNDLKFKIYLTLPSIVYLILSFGICCFVNKEIITNHLFNRRMKDLMYMSPLETNK